MVATLLPRLITPFSIHLTTKNISTLTARSKTTMTTDRRKCVGQVMISWRFQISRRSPKMSQG
ncbi:hypothetical protein EMCG_08189 [[Emmonsia] crescens]|uniref:Uncharacterized protein n=1 Tax=[Emmonsia] crescens TaxID=73230 RepID=A0A0G2JAP2_9EURO|nr:hypothetical protein EMCG_08189 [Emmonsia crescens UAMH 3008]